MRYTELVSSFGLSFLTSLLVSLWLVFSVVFLGEINSMIGQYEYQLDVEEEGVLHRIRGVYHPGVAGHIDSSQPLLEIYYYSQITKDHILCFDVEAMSSEEQDSISQHLLASILIKNDSPYDPFAYTFH